MSRKDKYEEMFEFWEQNNTFTQDTVVASVISKFRSRSNIGIEKYGVTLDREDLSLLEWINHAQEEAMDLILYLEKMKEYLVDKK
jgi:hypothetical protein